MAVIWLSCLQVPFFENEIQMDDDLPDYSRILHLIFESQDPKKLMAFAMNAQKKNVPEIHKAALARLNTLRPVHKEGGFEHGFWEMLTAYQNLLLKNNRPTMRLMKAWETAQRSGEISALTHWVENAEQAWAFEYFHENGLANKTAEKLVLSFPKKFEAEICEKAKERIANL